MVYSASQDLTAAWYAAAPPPPPPPAPVVATAASKRASMAGAPPSYGVSRDVHPRETNYAKPSLRSSSSSQSFSFDRRAVGDHLPVDTHAPEPERPVSRNAMARARERERQRTRTNSTSGYPADVPDADSRATMLNANGAPPPRSPSPAPRSRRESSPAAAESWSGHVQQQQQQQQQHLPQQQHHQQYPYQIRPHQQHAQPAYTGQSPIVHGYSAPPTPASSMYAPSPAPAPQAAWQTSGYPSPAPPQALPYHQAHTPMSHPGYAAPQPQATYAIPGGPAYGAAAHPGHSSAPQTPIQSHPWPQQYVPTYAQAQHQSPPAANGWGQPAVTAVGHPHTLQSAVPFPSAAMPPPPVPSQQPYAAPVHGTPPGALSGSKRPLPSPSSRSSSQSSSVGTRASTTSLGSATGTVRRSLPQPPSTPGQTQRSESQPARPQHTFASSVRTTSDGPGTSSVARHESVRMAAEELMSRGPPRRKGIPSAMRTRGGGSGSSGSNSSSGSAHANASRSDGSITDGTLPGTSYHRPGPPSTPAAHAAPRGRAESASCLEREMRAMKLYDGDAASSSSSYAPRTPLVSIQPVAPASQQQQQQQQQHDGISACGHPIRASSPRPIRAAPTPAPQVTIDSPVIDVLPPRPMSRGPKDDNERRRSLDASQQQQQQQQMRAPSFGVPQIRSPPPDRKPPVPSIMFDEEPTSSRSAAANGGVPSIVLPGGDDEQSLDDNVPPQICVSSDETPERPTGTISISVSSSGLAQRSTTSSQTRNPSSRISPLAAPEPASAPSVGSGAGCATCKKWIGGRVVHALSHTFHPDCFVCVHCSEPLEHVAFYEHEGQPYCHFDFHELFSKRCFHCRTPIVDQRYITINDVELVGKGGETQERCYHDTHFFCANCGDPFLDPKMAASAAGADVLQAEIEDENGIVRYGGREFVVHKGYPYCEPCHVSLHKPRCKGCRRPIVDEDYLTALRAKWHVGCFACQRCQQPIDSDNFFVRDGEAYDEQCYKIKLRSEL